MNSLKDGKILYEGDESEISAGKIRVEFIKSYRDNPKVNAIIVGKGSLSGMYNIFIYYLISLNIMAIRVVEFSNGVCKIRKIFA